MSKEAVKFKGRELKKVVFSLYLLIKNVIKNCWFLSLNNNTN